MKVKFVKIDVGTKLVHNGKVVNVGDILDLPKDRAEHYISKGNAEEVKEKSTKKNRKEKDSDK
jgi:hypothetical protein